MTLRGIVGWSFIAGAAAIAGILLSGLLGALWLGFSGATFVTLALVSRDSLERYHQSEMERCRAHIAQLERELEIGPPQEPEVPGGAVYRSLYCEHRNQTSLAGGRHVCADCGARTVARPAIRSDPGEGGKR